MDNPWHLYLMSAIYIIAGIMHFIKPKMYKKVIPNYIPLPRYMVLLSGIFEILLGILLLLDSTRSFAIYGIAIMLILFLPVHVQMIKPGKSFGIPLWIRLIRIPLQFILIAWAFYYL